MDDARHRAAALCALFAAIGVALATHGAAEAQPDPDRHDYPDDDHLVAEYDRYVGSDVVVSGRIESTEPTVLRIESGAGEEMRLTLTGAEFERGDNVWLYGTARPDRTVAVESAVVRDDWELWYMYAVSALGGLVALGRFVDGWRLDRRRLAFEPREVPLSARLSGRGENAGVVDPAHSSADDRARTDTEGE